MRAVQLARNCPFTPGQMNFIQVVFSASTMLLPAYYFLVMRGLDLSNPVGLLLFSSSTLISFVFLLKAYSNLTNSTLAQLIAPNSRAIIEDRSKKNYDSKEKKRSTILENYSNSYAVFAINSVFVCVFLSISAGLPSSIGMPAYLSF